MENKKPISPYVFPGMTYRNLPKDVADYIKSFSKKALDEINEDVIMDAVESVTKISRDEIISTKRDRVITDARRMYIHNVKKYLNKSYVTIGKSLSGRDHTTVSFSLRVYDDLYKSDDRFKRMADKVTKIIECY